MKLKYYLNDLILLLIVISVVMIILIVPTQAGILGTSNTNPSKILKCQQSVITANYTDIADIVLVTVQATNSRSGDITLYPMTNLGSGLWSRGIGNDNTTSWGNYSINFIVTDTIGGTYTNTSTNHVFVYSDDCIGTDIQGYKNTSYRNGGFGNYTRVLFSGDRSLIEFTVYPFVEYFGYAFYLIILFMICGVLYIKNQSVAQPLTIGFIGIAVILTSVPILEAPNIVPYKAPIMMLMGVGMAAIFWRLFKSQ